MVLLLSGESGVGKTTLAKYIQSQLNNVIVLDGDDIREELNSDLGFSDEDIMENMRRVSSLARLLSKQGYFIIVSCIAPLRSGRRLFKGKDSYEVRVTQSNCKERDVKGLYKKNTAFKEYQEGGADYVLSVDGKSLQECFWEIMLHAFGSEKSDW